MDEKIIIVPALALRGLTVLPHNMATFDVTRDRSIKALEEAMHQDQRIFLITQKKTEIMNPEQEDLYPFGTLAVIKKISHVQENVLRVMVSGEERAELYSFSDKEDYLEAQIRIYSDEECDDVVPEAKQAMVVAIQQHFHDYADNIMNQDGTLLEEVQAIEELVPLMDRIVFKLGIGLEIKQEILSKVSLTERYEAFMSMLLHQEQAAEVMRGIHLKLKEKVDQHQREYILREEMAVIREELNEDGDAEADEFVVMANELEASEEVKEHILKEIKRFRNIPTNAAESTVMRNYIETLLELPWEKKSTDNNDIVRAKEILDRDHYGMDKVKDRILDFLAVRSLTSKGESPIICLVGPPGTGKTSIARSVAESLDRQYVRVCLGGVHDEAEIRGHRRTYVGAMPGRIVSALRQAGTCNPLILLDEIDKVSSDYKGDATAALLEVLDSEQNQKFRDHYVETAIDLSEVLFICTANAPEDIPRPLFDRMEVIEVSSYTENEKFHIAKEHLVAKQKKANGLTNKQLQINDAALHAAINGYTREAGVRGLERKIGEICRKAARAICEKNQKSVRVTEKNLEKFLGRVKYDPEKKNDRDEIGTVRGLAWTSVGGVTLQIEVALLPGKGETILTGQLGDVMMESAEVGKTWVRSVLERYGQPADFLKEKDVHLHILDGATPKDGPSAGITMATAMLSAITQTPVRCDVAMTGEISIRGRVLPIGGLKEKLLAARTAGMKKVCIPVDNRKDLQEISEEITEGMEIIPVESMEEVLDIAFVK